MTRSQDNESSRSSREKKEESFLFWFLYNKLARQRGLEIFELTLTDLDIILTFVCNVGFSFTSLWLTIKQDRALLCRGYRVLCFRFQCPFPSP